MFDWLNKLINDGIERIVDVLNQYFSFINPYNLIRDIAAWFAVYLPGPVPVDNLIRTMRTGLPWIAHYTSLVSYFIDVSVLVNFLLIAALVEGILLIVRSWRLARSFVT